MSYLKVWLYINIKSNLAFKLELAFPSTYLFPLVMSYLRGQGSMRVYNTKTIYND